MTRTFVKELDALAQRPGEPTAERCLEPSPALLTALIAIIRSRSELGSFTEVIVQKLRRPKLLHR